MSGERPHDEADRLRDEVEDLLSILHAVAPSDLLVSVGRWGLRTVRHVEGNKALPIATEIADILVQMGAKLS